MYSGKLGRHTGELSQTIQQTSAETKELFNSALVSTYYEKGNASPHIFTSMCSMPGTGLGWGSSPGWARQTPATLSSYTQEKKRESWTECALWTPACTVRGVFHQKGGGWNDPGDKGVESLGKNLVEHCSMEACQWGKEVKMRVESTEGREGRGLQKVHVQVWQQWERGIRELATVVRVDPRLQDFGGGMPLGGGKFQHWPDSITSDVSLLGRLESQEGTQERGR